MPKNVPIPIHLVKSQPVVLTSSLLKIGPLRDSAGTVLRFTSIDKDEQWDCGDGLGVQTWYAATGVQFSTHEATNDLSVDNAEAQTLLPVLPTPGITVEMVVRGDLDTVEYAEFEHAVGQTDDEPEIMSSGVIGECRVEQNILVITELRGWGDLLNQTGIISATSLDCRTKEFGSQEGDEREWCGFDITSEWVPFTVTAVGTETVREFYSDDLTEDLFPPSDGQGYFAPGLVRWSTGDNAGISREVESFTGGDSSGDGYVSLRFTTPKPIQVDDQGEIRRDCTRKWTGHNSCQTYFGIDKGAHFNGEPNINIGDSIANSIPGVNATVSTGGTGE